jgi:hypothetical protein
MRARDHLAGEVGKELGLNQVLLGRLSQAARQAD